MGHYRDPISNKNVHNNKESLCYIFSSITTFGFYLVFNVGCLFGKNGTPYSTTIPTIPQPLSVNYHSPFPFPPSILPKNDNFLWKDSLFYLLFSFSPPIKTSNSLHFQHLLPQENPYSIQLCFFSVPWRKYGWLRSLLERYICGLQRYDWKKFLHGFGVSNSIICRLYLVTVPVKKITTVLPLFGGWEKVKRKTLFLSTSPQRSTLFQIDFSLENPHGFSPNWFFSCASKWVFFFVVPLLFSCLLRKILTGHIQGLISRVLVGCL